LLLPDPWVRIQIIYKPQASARLPEKHAASPRPASITKPVPTLFTDGHGIVSFLHIHCAV
jgi:hypothetical protein